MAMSSLIAVIGGSGGIPFEAELAVDSKPVETPYGYPSAPLARGAFCNRDIIYLPRHGTSHSIAPHRINYQANIWALNQVGAKGVIALNTVGGVRSDLSSGDIVIPDQVIDYTWGRKSTYFDSEDGVVAHLEITEPFDAGMRAHLLRSASRCGVRIHEGGVYAATQGPRFETAAEVNRIARDGGDIVGMTAMPEACLAAELGLSYSCVSLVVNPAAGRGGGVITQKQIADAMESGRQNIALVLEQAICTAEDTFGSSPRLLRP